MKGKILIVDDEANILELVQYNLEIAGFVTIKAENGRDALSLIRQEKPDLVVLDVMLPEMDGFEVLAALRKESTVPVIMLTAKKEEIDRVLGLEMGADDYLTKPFSPRELAARIKAILRRVQDEGTDESERIIRGPMHIDSVKRSVAVNGRPIELTAKEFELLRLLAAHPGRVFTRDHLLQDIWGYDYYGDTKTIDVHIRHLRTKIEEDPSHPKMIITVRGVGYKFQE